MKYKDNNDILIGDKVYVKSENIIGIIEAIIEDSKDREYWGVNDNGIMIKDDKIFGRLFIPKSMINDLELIKRG